MKAAVGLDLGSLWSVIGVVRQGGVEVICNEASYRETSNTIGYGEQERLLGDMGKSKMNSNYKNTVTFFNRWFNVDYNSPDFRLEKRFIFWKTTKSENNKVLFNVNYQGESITLTPEQVLAAQFVKIRQVLAFNNIIENDIVISYPGFYSQQEKEALLIAAKIGGVNVSRLVSEVEANVKNYSIFRRSDIKDTKRIVAFVDFGHSKTSVYFAEIDSKKANVLYEKHERHCGARDLDILVYDKYSKIFESDTSNNLDEHPKSRMRLLEAILKQRYMLSGNEEASCNVEYLVEDEDFSASLTRDEFEAIGAPVFQKFQNLLLTAIEESKINIQTLHSVEIIGGATRIPKIQTLIAAAFQVPQVSKTTNLGENCARGCAITAAEVSPNFQVVAFDVTLKNNYPIKCKYLVNKDEGVIEKTGTLFKKGVDTPISMSVTMAKTKQTTFDIYYDGEAPERSSTNIFKIETEVAKPNHEDYSIVVRTAIDNNGNVNIKAVELEEKFVEEQKQPKPKVEKKITEEKPAEGEGEAQVPKPAEENKMEEEEFEIVKVKKTRTTGLMYNTIMASAYPAELVEQWKSVEQRMFKRDQSIHDTNKAKNDLESLIYDSKDRIGAEWANYIRPDEQSLITNKYESLNEWIENEGRSVVREVYVERLNQLQALVAPVVERKKQHELLVDAIGYLSDKIVQYSQESENIEKNTEKYGHLTKEDKANYASNIKNAISYHSELSSKLQSGDTRNDVPVLAETVYKFTNKFEDELCKLLNKPKPKVEEPKKEEQPNGTTNGSEHSNKMDEETLNNGSKMDEEPQPTN